MRKILSLLLLLVMVIPSMDAQKRIFLGHNQSPQGRLVVQEGTRRLGTEAALKAPKHQRQTSIRMKAVGKPVKYSGTETGMMYQCSVTKSSGTVSWSATFIFDKTNKKVTIKGILDGLLGDVCEDVNGTFDKDTIYLNCQNFSKDSTNYTHLASYEGGIDAFLGAGVYEKDGSTSYINLIPVLKLSVSQDYQTISSNGTAVGVVVNEGDGNPYFDSTAKEGLVYTKMTDKQSSELTPRSLDFGSIYYNQNTKKSVELKSTGTKDLNYKIIFSSDKFSIVDSLKTGTLKAMKSVTFPIVFTPKTVGDYNETATITAGDSIYKVSLQAKSLDIVKDFSALVVKGDKSILTWNNLSDYPWSLENGVATSGNYHKHYTNSVLSATINSKTATKMTFDFSVSCDFQDTLHFVVDKVHAFDYVGKYGDTFTYIIPAGTHTLSWDYAKHIANDGKDIATLSNIKLESVSDLEGVSPDNSVSSITSNGWTNYNGSMRPVDQKATLDLNLNLTEAAGVSFDCASIAGKPIKILVDGKEEMSTEKADTTFFHNFSAAGQHKIECVCEGGDANKVSVSDVHLTKGAYREITRTYLLSGDSYYDENFLFTSTKGQHVSYSVEVKMTSAGKVILKNLMNNGNWTHTTPIKAKMKDNVITIAPTTTNYNIGTLYGYDDDTYVGEDYVGNRFWLVAGTMTGQKAANYVDQLNFKLSNDSTTMTPDTGFGVFYTYSYYNEHVLAFLKPGAVLRCATDVYSLNASKDTIDFGNGFAEISQVAKQLYVMNNGKKTDFTTSIEGDKEAFVIAPTHGSINTLSEQSFDVTFVPKKMGDFKAKMVITSDDEENPVEVILKGHADGKPDYSSIVTEGKDLISWDTSNDYPWSVKDGVAYSGNTGINSSSSKLTAKFTVPEGYVARLSSDAKVNLETGSDSYNIDVNGKIVRTVSQRDDNAGSGYVFDAGKYAVSFTQVKDANVYIPCKDICELSNVRLQLIKKEADCAIVLKPEWKSDYINSINTKNTYTVQVINKGSKPLNITSATAEAPYSVEKNETAIAAGDTARVHIDFLANKPGTYKGNIVLHTSAGDIPFTMEAPADYVLYLGQPDAYTPSFPICTFYTINKKYPLYTQSLYAADMLQSIKGCKITDMTFFSAFFGDVNFLCKDVDWQVGTPAYDEISDATPTGLTTVYSGAQLPIQNYELNVKFNEPYLYNGGNFMYGMDMKSLEDFEWQVDFLSTELKTSGLPMSGVTSNGSLETGCMAPYVRLKYIPISEGVQNNQNTAKKVVSVKYYNVSGVQFEEMQQGVNIVVTTYDDGSIQSQKQFKAQ